MSLDRRAFLTLAGSLAASAALAQGAPSHGWYVVRADDGRPVPNLRLPVEIASQVERLPGMIRTGSDTPDVTLVMFHDFNCPYCRTAARDIDRLLQQDGSLRIGLVNNAILSEGSKEAARVEIAAIKLHGRKKAHDLHHEVFALSGPVNGARALAAAKALGFDETALAKTANDDPEIRAALDLQMNLAAALALTATPSFILGGAGIVGYPGPKSLVRMIASVRKCELIACG